MRRSGKMVAIKTIFLGGACVLAVAGALALAHPGHPPIPAPTVAFEAQQSTIPFELFRGQRIVLQGNVNGTATSMMLDSGAGATVIDRAFADKIGLKGSQSISVRGSSGDVAGQIASGVTLSVGGLKLTKLNVLILDMSSVARAIGRPIPVVLGREAFKAGTVTIDFPKRTIRFANRAGFAAPHGAARLEVTRNGPIPRVRVSVAGLPPIDADLDIGNGGTVALAQSYWTKQPTLASLRHADSQTGGVGGIKPARRVTLPELQFARMRYRDVPATLNEDPNSLPTTGGNVGIELLKAFVVTVDLSGGALYLQPTGRAPQFDRERAGARTELAGDRLKVAFVSPDGPAAAAGLKAGDEIASVDGRPIDASYYSRPDWTRGEAGRAVALQRIDGSVVKVTLANYY
jgi:membrane-associated protease RseP (regulator of RpoE activity)